MSESLPVATNPGRLRVNPLLYVYCFPFWPLFWGCLGALLFIGALAHAIADAKNWGVAVFWGAIVFLMNALYWNRVYSIFWNADVCPAVVVSERPGLVAVWTNMTTDLDGWHPAVKIVRHPLKRMSGEPVKKGTRLATISHYNGNGENECWDNFYPTVVNCVTTNLFLVARAKRRVGRDDWQHLREYLRDVPKPFRPGIYFFD